MSKASCPAGCGQKYISKEHAERHADKDHPDWRIPKSKGWATPYGFVDFSEPVTYDKALAQTKMLHEQFAVKFKTKNADGGQTQDIESTGKSGAQAL